MRRFRTLFLLASIAASLMASPAGANAEREAVMLAALLQCDVTYASEPYASHVQPSDLADLDRAHGALQSHLARAFSEREAQLLVAHAARQRAAARPRADASPSAAVDACRRVVTGALGAYGWSYTWQAWIERR